MSGKFSQGSYLLDEWGWGEADNAALTGKKDGKLNSSFPVLPVGTNFPDQTCQTMLSIQAASSSNTHLCESVRSGNKSYFLVTCLLATTNQHRHSKILTFYKCPTRPACLPLLCLSSPLSFAFVVLWHA